MGGHRAVFGEIPPQKAALWQPGGRILAGILPPTGGQDRAAGMTDDEDEFHIRVGLNDAVHRVGRGHTFDHPVAGVCVHHVRHGQSGVQSQLLQPGFKARGAVDHTKAQLVLPLATERLGHDRALAHGAQVRRLEQAPCVIPQPVIVIAQIVQRRLRLAGQARFGFVKGMDAGMMVENLHQPAGAGPPNPMHPDARGLVLCRGSFGHIRVRSFNKVSRRHHNPT